MKKIVLVGDDTVGKTSLMNLYINKKFSNIYKATVGADFLPKKETINGDVVDLQIWDTAGLERPENLARVYKDADAFIIVFDVCNRKSFDRVNEIFDKIHFLTNNLQIPCILAATKIDMENSRVVSLKEIREKSAQLKIPFFESSAKASINVDLLFKEAAKLALAPSKTTPIDYKAIIDQIEQKLKSELMKDQSSSLEIGFFGSRTLSHIPGSSAPFNKRVPTPINRIVSVCDDVRANKITPAQACEKIYDIVHNKVLRLKNTPWDRFILWIRRMFAKLGIPSVKHPEQLNDFYVGINRDIRTSLRL